MMPFWICKKAEVVQSNNSLGVFFYSEHETWQEEGCFTNITASQMIRKESKCQSCLCRVRKGLKDQKSHFVWKMRQDLSSTIWQTTAYLKWWLTWQIAMWAQENNSTNRQKAWIFSSKARFILNLNWAKKGILGRITFIPSVLLGRLLHSLFQSIRFCNL